MPDRLPPIKGACFGFGGLRDCRRLHLNLNQAKKNLSFAGSQHARDEQKLSVGLRIDFVSYSRLIANIKAHVSDLDGPMTAEGCI